MTAKIAVILGLCGIGIVVYIWRGVAWRDKQRAPGREPDMEAGTPPDSASQTAALEGRLDALASSINAATSRVNVDLTHLRDEVARLNEQHADVDLGPVIERVDNLIVQVQNIDVTNVTESGPGDVTVEDGGAGEGSPGEDPAATDEPGEGAEPVEGQQ